jgi:predicted NBD/HSP70 family sugar kinase
MRKRNIDAVLTSIRTTSGISRAEIAKEASLAKATVSEIVDALLKKQVLHEIGVKASSGGRPAVGLTFNPFFGYTIGVCLDETDIGISLLDLDSNICAELNSKLASNWTAAEVSSFLIDSLDAMLSERCSSRTSILAMGVGMPGPVDVAGDGQVRAVHGKYGQVVQVLKTSVGCPIAIDSNTNMAATAAIHEKQLCQTGLVLVVRLGHHVRTALFADGKILSGSGGLAGELGHIAIPYNASVCSGSMNGCINTIAGVGAMLERCVMAGLAADSFDDLVLLCQSGNGDAQRIVREAGEVVGFGISMAINLVAPHVVVITGPATAAQEFIFGSLLESTRKGCVAENLERCKVITEPALSHAECYGAGLVALATSVDISGVATELK